MPTARPSRSTRRQVFTANGSAWKRSSGIWPDASRNRPRQPRNISTLGQGVHRSRGEDRQQRTVDDARCGWTAKITGPRRGTGRRRADARRSAAGSARAPAAAAASRGTSGRGAGRGMRARQVVVGGRATRGHAGASTASTSATTRSITSSRVYGVVSMWTAPSAIVSGAIVRPGVDLVAGQQRLLGRGDVGPALLGGAALRAGGGVGGQVDLHRGVGGDDRADVAALDDDAALTAAAMIDRWRPSSRARTCGHRAHRRDRAGDVLAADRLGHVDVVHGDRGGQRVGAGHDHRLVDPRRHGVGVVHVHARAAASTRSSRGTSRRCPGSAGPAARPRHATCSTSPSPDGPSIATTRAAVGSGRRGRCWTRSGLLSRRRFRCGKCSPQPTGGSPIHEIPARPAGARPAPPRPGAPRGRPGDRGRGRCGCPRC